MSTPARPSARPLTLLPAAIATATVLVLGAVTEPGPALTAYGTPSGGVPTAGPDDGENAKAGEDGKDGEDGAEIGAPELPVPPPCDPTVDAEVGTTGDVKAGPSNGIEAESRTDVDVVPPDCVPQAPPVRTAPMPPAAAGAPTAPGVPVDGAPVPGLPGTPPVPGVPTPPAPTPPDISPPTPPDVPGAPAVPVDGAPVPGVPGAPAVPVDGAPVPGVPGAPAVPVDGAPVPGVPGAPAVPVDGAPVPGVPGTPAAPGAPVPGVPGTPAVPAPVPPVPVGPQEYFTSDFEAGFADWGTCQSAVLNGDCPAVPDHYSLQLIPRDDLPSGGTAARFMVKEGDQASFGGERSELSDDNAGATVREGDERWYQWSMRIPEETPEPGGNWFIVMQWHASSGSPPLAIDLSKGTVDIGGDGVEAPRRTIGPIRKGEWVDYALHVKFSNDPDQGFVEAWENGVQTVELTKRQTMTSDQNYLKQGIYRDDASTGTAMVDFDNLRVTGPPNQGEVQPKLKLQVGTVAVQLGAGAPAPAPGT